MPGVDGRQVSIDLAPGCLGFSFCQVPVTYRPGSTASQIVVQFADGQSETVSGLELPASLSREIFRRTGRIERIEVRFP